MREGACLLPDDHPVHFILDFADALPDATWNALGIAQHPNPRGAPAYAPQLLLAAWLYGFMTGVRSSRILETACREQLPFRWLTGGATWHSPHDPQAEGAAAPLHSPRAMTWQ